MKKIKKIFYILNLIILVSLLGVKSTTYGVERLVDIPVPPNNSGYADFSSEDGEKKEYLNQDQNKKNENQANELLGKSGNNYLKLLEIEGYQIEPKFDPQINNYTIDIKDENRILYLKINAEAEENDKTKIEGTGTIEINNDTSVININVIAENGNLNVYTINIKRNTINNIEKNEENKVDNKENIYKKVASEKNIYKTLIFLVCGVSIFVVCFIIVFKKSKKGKHNK